MWCHSPSQWLICAEVKTHLLVCHRLCLLSCKQRGGCSRVLLHFLQDTRRGKQAQIDTQEIRDAKKTPYFKPQASNQNVAFIPSYPSLELSEMEKVFDFYEESRRTEKQPTKNCNTAFCSKNIKRRKMINTKKGSSKLSNRKLNLGLEKLCAKIVRESIESFFFFVVDVVVAEKKRSKVWNSLQCAMIGFSSQGIVA